MAVALNNGRCHTNGWAERRPNAAHRRCGSGTSSVIHSLAWPGPQGAAGSLPVGWTCCLFQVMCQRPLGWLQVRPQLSSALKGEDGDGISPPSCSWAIHVKKLQGLVNREMVWEELARASLWHCPDWLECPERDGPQGQKGTSHPLSHLHFPIPVRRLDWWPWLLTQQKICYIPHTSSHRSSTEILLKTKNASLCCRHKKRRSHNGGCWISEPTELNKNLPGSSVYKNSATQTRACSEGKESLSVLKADITSFPCDPPSKVNNKSSSDGFGRSPLQRSDALWSMCDAAGHPQQLFLLLLNFSYLPNRPNRLQ